MGLFNGKVGGHLTWVYSPHQRAAGCELEEDAASPVTQVGAPACRHDEHPGTFENHRCGGPPCRDSDSMHLGWGRDIPILKAPQVTVKGSGTCEPEITELMADQGIVSDVLISKMIIKRMYVTRG